MQYFMDADYWFVGVTITATEEGFAFVAAFHFLLA
jgi:hypothetical protein